jgi:hypothetical protein
MYSPSRPLAIALLSVASFVVGLLGLATGGQELLAGGSGFLEGLAAGGLGALTVICALALWEMRSWAGLAAGGIYGLLLVLGLGDLFGGRTPEVPSLALALIGLFYLTSRKDIFTGSRLQVRPESSFVGPHVAPESGWAIELPGRPKVMVAPTTPALPGPVEPISVTPDLGRERPEQAPPI